MRVVKRSVVVPTPQRISFEIDQVEVARASIYYFKNELHTGENTRVGAFLEDVFVKEEYRSRGLGKQIVNLAIEHARQSGAYKLIANSRSSRTNVHEFYKKLGFSEHGKEFRIDL